MYIYKNDKELINSHNFQYINKDIEIFRLIIDIDKWEENTN